MNDENKLKHTIPGGAYLDGDRYVDANGQELKPEQVTALEKLQGQQETAASKAPTAPPPVPPTVAAVLEQVQAGTLTAQAALDTEKASQSPRTTLVSRLEELVKQQSGN